MRDFASAHNDYLDADRHLNSEEMLEPFVEEDTSTEEDRAHQAAYHRKLMDIELAAERQIAEMEEDRVFFCEVCGAEMEIDDAESDIGKPAYWYCPDCEGEG